jgi:mannitol-1-/sugar-/sorbitol-6-phosphatase
MTATGWRGEAILFDLDGVLVDSLAASERAWLRWAAPHGVDEQLVLDTIHGYAARDSVKRLAPQLDAEREAATIEDDQVNDTAGVVALPGAAELTAELPPNRWAVVTGGTVPLAEARLAAADLPLPDVLVTIDALEHGKPAPDGFLAAAAELGFDPSACLVVENAPSGVAAGIAAGATVLALLTSHTREDLEDAHLFAPNLATAPPLSIQ